MSLSLRSESIDRASINIYNGNKNITVNKVVINILGNNYSVDVEIKPLTTENVIVSYVKTDRQGFHIVSARGR